MTDMATPMPAPITLTEAAWAHVEKLAAGRFGLRIGLKKGGCAGMEYRVELVDEAAPHDEVIEKAGAGGSPARVIVAANAQMFLFGMEVDYEEGLLESGFTFNNPNVAEACGCGTSINFTVDRGPGQGSD